MKVRVNSKKGLKTSLSVLVDKKTIQKKLDEKLLELQNIVGQFNPKARSRVMLYLSLIHI